MKTSTLYNGQSIDYIVMQENDMKVSAAIVSDERVANFGESIELGVVADIDEIEIQEIIRAKLYPA